MEFKTCAMGEVNMERYGSIFNLNMRLLNTKEDGNKKYLVYDVKGFGYNNLIVEKIFINKTKQTQLKVYGAFEDGASGYKNEIDFSIDINTEIYDKYSFDITNGLLTVILYEIENEESKFELV